MSLSTMIRRLRRPVVAAALISTGLLAAGGAVAPAQAQYYPGYAYSPYYSPYCNPYYYPYGCSVPYAYPSYSYAYPSYGYAPVVGVGFFGFNRFHRFDRDDFRRSGFHRGFGGGFHHGFGGGGMRGGGGGFHHR